MLKGRKNRIKTQLHLQFMVIVLKLKAIELCSVDFIEFRYIKRKKKKKKKSTSMSRWVSYEILSSKFKDT